MAERAVRIRRNTVTPPLENTVKDEFIKIVRGTGVHAHRIEDKYRHSIPDCYVDGGNWIEWKRIFIKAQGPGMSLYSPFTVGQRKYLMRDPCWDRNWAGLFFITQKIDFYIMICPFQSLNSKHLGDNAHRWNTNRMMKYAVPWTEDRTEAREYIGKLFGPQYRRSSNWHSDLAQLRLPDAEFHLEPRTTPPGYAIRQDPS